MLKLLTIKKVKCCIVHCMFYVQCPHYTQHTISMIWCWLTLDSWTQMYAADRLRRMPQCCQNADTSLASVLRSHVKCHSSQNCNKMFCTVTATTLLDHSLNIQTLMTIIKQCSNVARVMCTSNKHMWKEKMDACFSSGSGFKYRGSKSLVKSPPLLSVYVSHYHNCQSHWKIFHTHKKSCLDNKVVCSPHVSWCISRPRRPAPGPL